MAEQEKNDPQEINWDKLEAEQRNLLNRDDRNEEIDMEAIKEEMKNLTEEEELLPYPKEFLADINLLRKSILNNKAPQVDDEEE